MKNCVQLQSLKGVTAKVRSYQERRGKDMQEISKQNQRNKPRHEQLETGYGF